MSAVKQAGRSWDSSKEEGVQLTEWEKKDWTYHAKGLVLQFRILKDFF